MTKTNFGTKVAWGEDDARTSNMPIARARAEKAHDTIPHSTMKNRTGLADQQFAYIGCAL